MSITGKWTVFYRWANLGMAVYKAMNIDIKQDGTFSGKDMGTKVSGTWSQVVGMLLFRFNENGCTYSGNWVGGKSVTGTMTAFNAEKQEGDFYMLHDTHFAHVAKRSELGKSAEHWDAQGRIIKPK